MNFEYNISTGEDIISGSFFTNKELNFRTSFHSAGHSFDGQVLSGSQTVLASLNSQTLLEETPSVEQINNIKYFSVETGDFYVTKDTDNKNNLYFNGFDANRDDIILYDKKYSHYRAKNSIHNIRTSLSSLFKDSYNILNSYSSHASIGLHCI